MKLTLCLEKAPRSFLLAILVVVLAASPVAPARSQELILPEPVSPLELAGHLGGQTGKVVVSGQNAYLASGPELTILDISNPSTPHRIGYALAPGTIHGVAVQGQYVYLVWDCLDGDTWDYSGGVLVFDVSAPSNPVEVGSYPLPGNASGLVVSGDYLYALWFTTVLDGRNLYTEGRLLVLDITNPQALLETGRLNFGIPGYGAPLDMVIGNGYAYLLTESWQLTLSLENSAQPQLLHADWGGGNAIVLAGDYAYVAQSHSLRVFSLSDPAQPVYVAVAGVGSLNSLKSVAVAGQYVYLSAAVGYDGNTRIGGGVYVFDCLDPTQPVAVGNFPLPSGSYGIDLQGGIAFVSAYDLGLQVLDTGNPAQLKEIGAYRAPGAVDGLAVHGAHVYALTGLSSIPEANGVRAIQIANPRQPVEESFMGLKGGHHIAAVANLGYVAASSPVNDGWTNRLQVIDLSDSSSLAVLGTYKTTSNIAFRGLAEQDRFVYVAYWRSLLVLDARNPADIIVTVEIPATTGIEAVAIKDHYLYTPDGGLRIFDLSNPSEPVHLGSCSFPDGGYQIALWGQYAYVVGSNGLHVVDVSDPARPVETGFVELAYSSGTVAAEGGYVFLTRDQDSLRVMDATDPSHPFEMASLPLPGYAAAVRVQAGYVYVAGREFGIYVFRFNPLIHELFFPVVRI